MGDLDLIRPLGLAGVRCAIVTAPGSVPTRSRFTHFVIDGSLGEISDGADKLVRRLEDFAASQTYPPVLYYQEDEQLLFVSRHRERLARSFRFVVAEPTLVEDLVDKGRFHVLAARLGLPLPRTRRVQPVPDASLPEVDLKFPLVAKPLRRRKSWGDLGYRTKAVPVATSEALRDLWPHWISQGMDLLLQEAIPGPESRIKSYHVYVDQEGAIVGEFTGRKIRTFPPSLGYSTALTLTDSEDVLGLGRSVIDKLGLRGVAKLDFKRDPDGELHLLEVNPRFNLWHHLGAVGGVNLPALVYNDLVGLPRLAPSPRARAGVRWCRLSDDWSAAKASGIPFQAWLPWALGCDAKSVVWSDPMPFLQTAWTAVRDQLTARLTRMLPQRLSRPDLRLHP